MKKQIITLLLLAIAYTVSAQNATAEQEALYYIKKAYSHRKDADKTEALKYLKVFEDYLSANLKPENVGDSTSYYYANTVSYLVNTSDKDTKTHESINWQTVYNYQIKQAEKGNLEAQSLIGIYYMAKKDFKGATKWLTPASKNNKLAFENLINVFLFEKDFERATSLNLQFTKQYGIDYLFSLSEQGNRTATLFGAYYYLLNQSFNASLSRKYIFKIKDEDRDIKLIFSALIDLKEENYEKAIRVFENMYNKGKYDWAAEIITVIYFNTNKLKLAEKWAKKTPQSPLATYVSMYRKCKNAMSVSDFDYCNKVKEYLNILSTYNPFSKLEKELDVYFKLNCSELLMIKI
ncbi:hypothetical protein CAPN008_22370 [Capnocytophaga canis]|uniref:hypothetical protein n=1 Tax=Capnocytophaga canis TaxID=1848903 RepID=UPI001AC58E36|nr:hypothetical protein [Capnocytophaga canis]GIM62187.1 hypothetical protein CAPN008_22370 [Capnocytophaga canis]